MHISNTLSLPCQPRVVALLLHELASDFPNLQRLNQLFSSDPVLAGWLLGHANAGVYQLNGQICGIPQAVALLGPMPLRALLKKAQTNMAGRVAGVEQLGPLSVATARLARGLASLLALDASTVYAAGLLHALGQVVLHQTQPQAVVRLTQQLGVWDPRRPLLEMQTLGYAANQSSVLVLRTWGVPSTLCQLIKAMEQPLESSNLEPMVAVLHLAAWTQRARCSGWAQRDIVQAFPLEVAMAVGLDMDVVLQQEGPDWSQSQY